MHLDPAFPKITLILLIILTLGLIFKKLGQPSPVAYLISGILLGPDVLSLVESTELITRLGSIGVVLLLFFAGLEIPTQQIKEDFKIACLGTLFQIFFSVGIVFVIGKFFGWPIERAILLGFVISLSSTAVVLKILVDEGMLHSRHGRDVTSVLIAQDIAIIPMLMTINVLGGSQITFHELFMQVLGGCLLVLSIWLSAKYKNQIGRFIQSLGNDKELQVFSASILGLGLACISGLFGLSVALGAFVAGMIVSMIPNVNWIHDTLSPFRILFLAIFFVSVGMLIDIQFLSKNYMVVFLLLSVIFLINTIINSTTLRFLGRSWKESLYSGALLAQVGEFSFLIATIGYQVKMISDYAYQTTLSVIFLSLLMTPFWLKLFPKPKY